MLQHLLRARRYNALHADPRISSRTSFFAAAAVVTRAIGQLRPSGFLWRLSSSLEKANVERAAAIRAGALYAEGNIGSNTADFIRVEQSLVQVQLDCLRDTNPDQYAREVAALNRALGRLTLSRKSPWVDYRVARALSYAQQDAGQSPDFASQAFRELVGRHIAAQIAAPRPDRL